MRKTYAKNQRCIHPYTNPSDQEDVVSSLARLGYIITLRAKMRVSYASTTRTRMGTGGFPKKSQVQFHD